jgi:crotonobetainyl-CoA:carnitine CoA-transferase CaiB-like acyl-CoA transferase
MSGPLTGVRVLDLSRILAGPWATQVLADFGAEVFKIEKPEGGDDTRRWGPPYLKDAEGKDTELSAYFVSANRGKYSIALDFTTQEGQATLHHLIKHCDVLVENYKVGGLKKYGLDYDSIKAINPAIIYCSITGFGQTGPMAQEPGYDAIIQGMGGLMSITGEADGKPGGGPQKVGVAVADLMTGMYAVSAITAALYHREKTGEGQYIELALLDTQVAWLANQNMNYLIGGDVPQRCGTAHPNIVPYQAMPSKDGHFMLAVGNDRQFRRLCEVIGCPELATDPRFATNQQRVVHRECLIERLLQIFNQKASGEWLTLLKAAQVPCAPINSIKEVFEDPQVKARSLLFELNHPQLGAVPQVANPIKFSKTPIEYGKAPPALGEDNKRIEKLI